MQVWLLLTLVLFTMRALPCTHNSEAALFLLTAPYFTVTFTPIHRFLHSLAKNHPTAFAAHCLRVF
jgi:hypothetical protein